MKDQYRKQVNLLLEVLPFALEDERVALKGGTAINLFHQDFPRLSVDIDLCYLPLEDRTISYTNIHEILGTIKRKLENQLNLKVDVSSPLGEIKEAKLYVSNKDALIKLEPNYVVRGSLFNPEEIALAKGAAAEFGRDVTSRCLNIADTYGGKICAALDRQHPRDLFDVKLLFEGFGITTDVKNSFMFYLLSHNRPIHEILSPNFKNISEIYEKEFVEMAIREVPLNELEDIRIRLVREIKNSLTTEDKDFIVSFVEGKPNWALYKYDKIQHYPSVKWKIHNLDKLVPAKRAFQVKALTKAFV